MKVTKSSYHETKMRMFELMDDAFEESTSLQENFFVSYKFSAFKLQDVYKIVLWSF